MSAKKKWHMLSFLGLGIVGICVILLQTYSESHSVKCSKVLRALQKEWILSHSSITPQMGAGTELPPADWLNKRSQEIGEDCHFD